MLVTATLASLCANVWLYRAVATTWRLVTPEVTGRYGSRATWIQTQADEAQHELILPGVLDGPGGSVADATSAAPDANAPEPKSRAECQQIRVDALRKKLSDDTGRDPVRREMLSRFSYLNENGEVARELGVSTGQWTRLLEIHADQILNDIQGGQSLDLSLGYAATDAADTPVFHDIEAELGPSVASKWSEFLRTQPSRNWARSATLLLASVDLPINAVQRSRLILMHDTVTTNLGREAPGAVESLTEQPRDASAFIEWTERSYRREANTDRRLLEAAKGILSAEQLAALRQRAERNAERGRARIQRLRDDPREFESYQQGARMSLDENGC